MQNVTQRPNRPVLNLALSRIFFGLSVAICVCMSPHWVSAQVDSTGTVPAAASSIEQLQKDFDIAIDNLRSALKAIKKTGADHYQNKSTEAHMYREKWEAEAAVAQKAHEEVGKAAFALFFAVDNPDPELVQVVGILNRKLIPQGHLTHCYRATKKLLENQAFDPELTNLMGQVSIMTNDFDTALEFYRTRQSDIESFDLPQRLLYNDVEKLQRKYVRELELREADAQGEDLPHAIVTTSKGTIVIELFENQAPETVGNFVNLVTTGFYDGIIFHRVLRNILAETGKMTMNRDQPVGYTIYDECKRPDARHHFRGSVTMTLNNNEENSGAAEFRIMLVPGPNLDGRNTVFGRVISGMAVMDTLTPTFVVDEEEGKEEFIPEVIPDKIISITIDRLRKHEYQPNRVKK